mgnify:CR=1 FL=1
MINRIRHDIFFSSIFNGLKRWIPYSLFYGLIIIVFVIGCTSDTPDKSPIPVDEIMASASELIPDTTTRMVTVELIFKNLDNVAFLHVVKSGGAPMNDRIARSQLSSPYILRYEIQPADPERFQLILSAEYEDGNVSNRVVLDVDNRWGFFVRKVERIARVTGIPMDGETVVNPNNTARDWNVGGTDLGIIWEMQPGQYGIFFGDTFGQDFRPRPANPGPNGGSWRSNVLGFSNNKNLDEGLVIHDMAADESGHAREIIYSAKDNSGRGDWTSIPTAAIRANGVDYVHYFNMRNWDGWITNYSGLYRSDDNGQTWSKCEDIEFGSNSNFGQAGYFKKDGYVYMIGTQTGRDSPAHLARFAEENIEHKDRYEFWNGDQGTWLVGDENQATVIIDDKVGELSVLYNQDHEKWFIAYFNADRYNITMRTANQITGPWSEPYELAAGTEYSQLYGSYFHPRSVEGDELYFTMSMWLPYNVFLMKATIADMGKF